MGKKIVALLTILAIIFTVAICTPDSNAGIQTLNLSKQTKEIKVGESFQLTMTGVKTSSIKWKSSKADVVSISNKGVVKGLKVGTTDITGKYKNLKFTIKVTVKSKGSASSSPDGIYLGSSKGIDIYFVKATKKYIYMKYVNNTKKRIRVSPSYINFDDTTYNLNTFDRIAPNDFVTAKIWCNDPVIQPTERISGMFYIIDDESNEIMDYFTFKKSLN